MTRRGQVVRALRDLAGALGALLMSLFMLWVLLGMLYLALYLLAPYLGETARPLWDRLLEGWSR